MLKKLILSLGLVVLKLLINKLSTTKYSKYPIVQFLLTYINKKLSHKPQKIHQAPPRNLEELRLKNKKEYEKFKGKNGLFIIGIFFICVGGVYFGFYKAVGDSEAASIATFWITILIVFPLVCTLHRDSLSGFTTCPNCFCTSRAHEILKRDLTGTTKHYTDTFWSNGMVTTNTDITNHYHMIKKCKCCGSLFEHNS